MNVKLFPPLFCILCSSVALAGVDPAPQIANPNGKIAQEISDTTMSPFCPGRTISACPSGQAWELRQRIQGWLAEGYSPDAVRRQLLVIYGEDVRGTPRDGGFGLVGWLTPGIFVLLGLIAIAVALRRQKGRSEAAAPVAVDPAVLTKIEDELKRRSI